MAPAFYQELSNLKRPYTYLFPEIDEDEEIDEDVSLNYSEKQAFIEEYGEYMEMIYILCGGDLSMPTKVTEQYLLDLEREAFLSLLGERKTLERIQSILTSGKPLRN